MKSIADMVSGDSVADIGCDHGFVCIYLIQEKGIRHAIAMDINDGPLLRAKEHISRYGLDDRIDIRKSDGAINLNDGEADCAIIAGMGGRLTIKILKDSAEKFRKMDSIVLSPHSEADIVRGYLAESGYVIEDEDMVYDEGKYYPIIKCSYSGDNDPKRIMDETELLYGGVLIRKKHPVLKDYLIYRHDKLTEIKERLSQKGYATESAGHTRLKEVSHQLKMIEKLIDGM